jgi:hypothetical protein
MLHEVAPNYICQLQGHEMQTGRLAAHLMKPSLQTAARLPCSLPELTRPEPGPAEVLPGSDAVGWKASCRMADLPHCSFAVRAQSACWTSEARACQSRRLPPFVPATSTFPPAGRDQAMLQTLWSWSGRGRVARGKNRLLGSSLRSTARDWLCCTASSVLSQLYAASSAAPSYGLLIARVAISIQPCQLRSAVCLSLTIAAQSLTAPAQPWQALDLNHILQFQIQDVCNVVLGRDKFGQHCAGTVCAPSGATNS